MLYGNKDTHKTEEWTIEQKCPNSQMSSAQQELKVFKSVKMDREERQF